MVTWGSVKQLCPPGTQLLTLTLRPQPQGQAEGSVAKPSGAHVLSKGFDFHLERKLQSIYKYEMQAPCPSEKKTHC